MSKTLPPTQGPMPDMPSPTPNTSSTAANAPESGIVDIMNYGRRKDGIVPLWAGEGHLATPPFIGEAAKKGLDDGETFYTWQRGIPELRQAIADYFERTMGFASDAERFYVTGSGMQAIQLALQMAVDPGQGIIVPSPAWPNIVAAAGVRGAKVHEIEMPYHEGRFTLDLDAIERQAADANTRAIFVNTPSNPTGWVADLGTLKAVHDLAEKHDLWIIADEIYARFVFGDAALEGTDPARAPSFKDVAPDSPRVLYVNTLSKNWAMTGWRMGWLEVPAELGQTVENLIQYSTSGVAAFMQRAGVEALNNGDAFIEEQVARVKANRDRLAETFAPLNRMEVSAPDGAFYLFFGVTGEPDTARLARRLVDEVGVGLAPGTAFGPGGEQFLRMCFARDPEQIAEVADKIAAWISTSA